MWRWQGLAIGLIGLVALLVACPSSSDADVPFIAGVIFEDANANGQQDSGEAGQAGRTVYLDANDNAIFDSGETSTLSGTDGAYRFARLEPGSYVVRQVLPFGWRNVSGDQAATAAMKTLAASPDIVGGVNTDISQFPFMAAVGFDNEGEFRQFCGGVLISDTWVLTAAHCSLNADDDGLADPVAGGYQIMLGSADISGAGGEVVSVSRILLHPNFDVEQNTNGGFDVALWELSSPQTLAGNRFTVPLLDKATEALATEGTLATATGWGTLSSGGPRPDILQIVHVPISSSVECAATYKDATNFDTQICASVPEGGIDSCQGDSGGPLFVKNETGDGWYHAGTTSYGESCAAPGFPGVYARTSVLSEWIKRAAALPSNSYNVTVTASSEITAQNFGNRATTRAFAETIAPRWQATNLTPETENPAANAAVTYNWRIIDEGTSTFTCAFDADGGEAGAAVNVPCSAGENSFTTAAGYAEGIYLPLLSVQKAGSQAQTRRIAVVVGNPKSDEEVGVLSTTDTVDPNYTSNDYYIDYFTLDLTGIAAGTAILIQLESDFDDYIAIYESDSFVALEQNDELESASGQLIFVSEGASEYILGVSTFDPEVVGSYVLAVSSGTLAVF